MKNEKSIAVYTLGCRLNIYESDGILQQFISQGYSYKNWWEGADVVVVNTCTVTHQADSKNRNIIRSLHRINPKSKIIVTGCYAQTEIEELKKIPEVFAIIGNEKKSQIFQIFEELEQVQQKENLYSTGPLVEFHQAKKRRKIQNPFDYGLVAPIGHTRAYVKIQDGCDRKCSYCKIPLARGGGVSRPIDDILRHIDYLQSLKIPEIILTGVNIGWYRHENIRFIDLLEKILDRLYYSRLRISSIEPSDVNETLAKLTLHPKFCNFLHVPLQSGSDRILRLMKRSYNSITFTKRIEKVLKYNPNIFLGTDVIVGFPTETQEDLQNTMKLLKELNFAHIHPFPFSLRKGTEIENFIREHKISLFSRNELKAKVHLFLDLKKELFLEYVKKNLHQVFEGIIEDVQENHKNHVKILTDNYLNIRVDLPQDSQSYKKGQFIHVRLKNFTLTSEAEEIELIGEVL
ncbi:MAG: tRNA (N(6)-L-threonylcarbamoyladenosine(37)-C(2))-methylthiotransferase MtaB [Leptospiraceae bacterium]|nr:tRNA (N(6)-L-threonylcarbamoyladenosine(37)-C(2))-methylthiotransferase MtaB [Leptospiraceae bacterium]MDW7976535.1 tRNA (N(6)-L-threonylcarbamoyladenosine(37)-C(2))-methylthiotransferase MtaB [Leptospiraceae bacterium]